MRSKSKRLARLTSPGAEAQTTSEKRFEPSLSGMPPIGPVNWSGVGAAAPQLLNASGSTLPQSTVVVITWADAEWAAMEHVFCNSGASMAYSARNNPSHTGWTQYDKNIPKVSGSSDWTFWGSYRQVQVGQSKVLLLKSNTHLDWPGQQYLSTLIQQVIAEAKPSLILSIGTAGGAQVKDHVGTVKIVNGGTLYESNQPQANWPTYTNNWSGSSTIFENSHFSKLLFAVPTTQKELQTIASQFNDFYDEKYKLTDLNPENLNMADASPKINNLAAAGTCLLTADSFLVATDAGNLAKFACVEMDDAIIAEVCKSKGTAFGFVRNVSDPVQSASLPAEVQGNWGQAIYDAYGLYTSYNGAIAAWALIAGGG